MNKPKSIPVVKKEKESKSSKAQFALERENYIYLIIGFAIIVVGFILMIGGGSKDPKVFNPEIFSFTRITLAPVLVLFGFVFEVFAIMKKPKTHKQ